MKRALDLFLAAGLSLLLLPLFVLVGTALALASGRSPIYVQPRIGLRGRPFLLYKFRTMAPAAAGPEGGLRVTRLGRYLRRFYVDELPQLINVLKGDMSLVGPRPFRPEVFENQRRTWPEGVHWAQARHAIRPGMTGPWQVSHRAPVTVEQLFSEEGTAWREKRAELVTLDLEYVRNRSLATDAGILARTVVAIARRRSPEEDRSGHPEGTGPAGAGWTCAGRNTRNT